MWRGFASVRIESFEPRDEAANFAKRPALITELKSRGVDAIVIVGSPTPMAAKAVGACAFRGLDSA